MYMQYRTLLIFHESQNIAVIHMDEKTRTFFCIFCYRSVTNFFEDGKRSSTPRSTPVVCKIVEDGSTHCPVFKISSEHKKVSVIGTSATAVMKVSFLKRGLCITNDIWSGFFLVFHERKLCWDYPRLPKWRGQVMTGTCTDTKPRLPMLQECTLINLQSQGLRKINVM